MILNKLNGKTEKVGNLVASATLDMTQVEKDITETFYTVRCIEEDIESSIVKMGVVRRKIDGRVVILRASWTRDEVEEEDDY